MLIRMDVNLNTLLKMPPEMSKIAIYFFFLYFMLTKNTSIWVLQ